MKLSVPEYLHAKWLTKLCNHMTAPIGWSVYVRGRKIHGVTETVERDIHDLLSLEPFHNNDICQPFWI